MRGVANRINAFIVLVMTVCVSLPAWAENYIYTVRPGDTLWDLSDKYLKRGVAYTSRLQELNQVDDPESAYVFVAGLPSFLSGG